MIKVKYHSVLDDGIELEFEDLEAKVHFKNSEKELGSNNSLVFNGVKYIGVSQ